MKIKTIISALIILIFTSIQAQASQLPKEVKDYLISQKKVPSIRFDSVVVYNDNIMYLPVYPAEPKEVETLKIEKTYPANQTMDKLPDMVLFNNNFSLIKLVRTPEGNLTVKNLPELPSQIKTGMLPQDLMVPHGLVLPENFAGILGDVQIPLIGSAKTSAFVTGRKTAPLPGGKRVADTKKYNVPAQLKNKLFFVNNYQTEYLQIFSSTVSEPLYSLKTSGVMKDIKPVMGGKYLLIATNKQKNIDVVDVENEYIVKNIDLTALPSEIAVDEANKKAYVASVEDESLSIIDLDKMSVTEKVQLAGSPQRLSLLQDGTMLAYTDIKTSNIYVLDLEHEYENKLITNYPNVTKIILKNNLMYLIARTKPALRVVYYDLLQDNKVTKSSKAKKFADEMSKEEKANADNIGDTLVTDYSNSGDDDELEPVKMYATSIKDVKIGAKPVDMIERNGNVYVLSAGENAVYTYNISADSVKSEKLPMSGFSKSITAVPDSNLAVITNMSDFKYAVYDLEKDKALQAYPISEHINMITILERQDGQ